MALNDAKIGKKVHEAAFFGEAMQGLITGEEMGGGRVALRVMDIDCIPIMNHESTLLVPRLFTWPGNPYTGGHAEVILAVGAERLFIEEARKMFENYDAVMDTGNPRRAVKEVDRGSQRENEPTQGSKKEVLMGQV
jgi:hypothetical protein